MSKSPRNARQAVDQQIAEAWKNFYRTPEGRAAVGEMLTWCGVYQSVDSVDAIHLGEKNVGLRIIQMIGRKPDDAPVDAWDDSELLNSMIRNR